MKDREYGVYIGDFSPIHNKQLELAYKYMKENKLDGVVFVPTRTVLQTDIIEAMDLNILLRQAFRDYANEVHEDLQFSIDFKMINDSTLTVRTLLEALEKTNEEMKIHTNVNITYVPFLDDYNNHERTTLIRSLVKEKQPITDEYMKGDYKYMYMNCICNMNITKE